MGYVICEDCGGYYELQPGEHPEDFDRCECGGKLTYKREMIGETVSIRNESNFNFSYISKHFKTALLGAVFALIMLIKFLPALAGLLYIYMPQTIQYRYIIPILIILSFVASMATRIFGIRR